MTGMTSTYPYFVWSLGLLALAILALLITPRSLRVAVGFSGLFSIPSAFASVDFVPEYWDPVRIAEFLVGPEDVIFSFSTGVLSFLMALWTMRKRFRIFLEPKSVFLRLLFCYLFGYLLNTLFLKVIGMRPMQSALLTIGILGCGLLILRRELRILSFYGVICFTVFYTIYTKLGFVVFPGFLNQWSHANLSGLAPFGIPLEEIAWAAFCGAVWPLIAASVMNVRIIAPEHTIQSERKNIISLPGDISALGQQS